MSASAENADPNASPAGERRILRRPERPRLRHRVEHLVFRLAAGLLDLLPRDSSPRFGVTVARLYFAAARARRRILLENLARAFPEKTPAEIRDLATLCVQNFGETFMVFLDSLKLSREEVLQRVTVTGVEHLAAARARGRGVFLLSAHFGSWELGAIRAGMIGEPISSVVRPLDNPLLEEELALRRTRFGNRVIRKKDAAREILRALKRNETVAILVDQNVIIEEAIFVPFFGRPAATTPSLALLQLKSGATVVPVFTWPVGGGRYRLEFEAPLYAEDLDPGGLEREERVRRATARYMEVTERAVRARPEAWLWMHDRWRTRPKE